MSDVAERITPADVLDWERTLAACTECPTVEYAAFMIADGDDWLCVYCDRTHRTECDRHVRDIARWRTINER